MNLSGFINRPVLSTVISVFIVIFGLIGIFTLPVERYPDIAPPTISVSANYPGANAETVVNSVLAPLEESINGVEGMTYMTSTASNAGMGRITINFQTGFDPDMAQVNVQNRVSEALSQLPAEVTRSGVRVNKRQTSTLLMLFLVATDDRYDATFLQNYADLNIIPQILRVYGVGEASVNGAKTFTMRIWLKPEVMARATTLLPMSRPHSPLRMSKQHPEPSAKIRMSLSSTLSRRKDGSRPRRNSVTSSSAPEVTPTYSGSKTSQGSNSVP